MHHAAPGVRDSFYILARRTWDDGMVLESSAHVVVEADGQGVPVLTVVDEAGERACIAVSDSMAAVEILSIVQEMILRGANAAAMAGTAGIVFCALLQVVVHVM